MRAMRLGLMVFAALLSVQVSAKAQDMNGPCTMGTLGARTYGASYNPKSQPQPFTAKIKLTQDQQLAEGNRIHSYEYVRMARDSSGKTRTEQPMGCYRDSDGKLQLRMAVSINDQADHSFLNWQEGMPDVEKVARLNRYPAPPAPKKLTPEELAAMRKRAAAQQPSREEYKREDLGTRNFHGVEAHGSRTTRTIPPGQEGNELVLKVVDEEWRNNDLGMVMLAIHDDPRTGVNTWEVEEFDREEPVAALLLPPEGYRIVEMKPQVEVPVTSPQ